MDYELSFQYLDKVYIQIDSVYLLIDSAKREKPELANNSPIANVVKYSKMYSTRVLTWSCIYENLNIHMSRHTSMC